MKAAVYYSNSDVRVEEMPKPQIGEGEILVKVIASGICGSDCLEWYRKKKAPLVLGHEITGEIVEVASDVKKYKVGERVFVSHHVPCNTCRWCLKGYYTACETLHTTNYFPGGFSEYIRVPKINVDRGVFILPEEVSFEKGTLIEPLACVVRAQRVAGLKLTNSVLVIGSGISGLLHLLLAKAKGCGEIIAADINETRLEKAMEFGANVVINAKEPLGASLKEVTGGALADLVIVCTGAASAFNQALQCVDRGGTVLFFAPLDPGATFSVPINDFWRNEVKLVTSYGAAPVDISEAIELIRQERVPVEKMITHRLALKEIERGFKLTAEAKESIKVVIQPQR